MITNKKVNLCSRKNYSVDVDNEALEKVLVTNYEYFHNPVVTYNDSTYK